MDEVAKLVAVSSQSNAPITLLKRFGAAILDIFLCIVCIILVIPISNMVLANMIDEMVLGIFIFPLELIGIPMLYFIAIPLRTGGQTLGYKIVKIKLTQVNGSAITLSKLFVKFMLFTFPAITIPITLIHGVYALYSGKKRLLIDDITQTTVVNA